MPYKEPWAQIDERQLARFVIPKIPDSFQLSDRVNPLELLQWDKRELVKEIYQALKANNIKYDLEPFNSEKNTQLIRTYKEILETPKVGTCVDLAVLFCGICLAYNLLPLLIVLDGHAFAAVSMRYNREEYWNNKSIQREEERELFQEKSLSNRQELQKLIAADSFLPIECTGFASSQTTLPEKMPEGKERDRDGFLSFERAIEAGKEQINTSDRELKFALDVAIAHEYWKIKPYDIQDDAILNSVGEISYGDKVAGNKTTVDGDKVAGDKITVGDISGSTGIAIGRKSSVTVNNINQQQNSNNPEAQELADLLKQLEAEIENVDSGLIPKNRDKALKHLKKIGKFGNNRQNSDLRDDAETALDALPTILNQGTGLNKTDINTLLTKIKQNLGYKL